MPISVRIQRVGYRVAFRLLQLFWLIRRPAASGVKCVLTDGERILLVRHTYGNRSWDLPGGSMRRREPPLAAVQREMREELGVTTATWSALGQVRKCVDHRRDTVHCFRAEVLTPDVRLQLAELSTAEWFRRGELPVKLAPYVKPVLAHLPE
jgi:8-oxo-dGTP diphosphatase